MNENELIAEFMCSFPNNYWCKDDNQGDGEQLYFQPHDTEHQQMYPREMLFNKSWDWIIPVVEKYYDCLEDMDLNEEDFYWRTKLHEQLLDINIDGLYKVVVEFITFYNKTNK